MTTQKKATTKSKKSTNPNIIKNAVIRYDAEQKNWTIVKSKKTMEAGEHFSHGLMTGVKFSSYPVTEEIKQFCAPSVYKKSYVGVATGTLYIGKEAKSMKGAKNLQFGDGAFLDFEMNVIKKAKQLAMTPDRHALYWA